MKQLICKHCGEKLIIRYNKYHAINAYIFPQYCKNKKDKNGNVIEYGKLHHPIEENSK